MKNPISLSLILLVSLTLSACGPLLKSSYTPPEIAIPPAWQNGSGLVQDDKTAWWKKFGDKKLDAIIEEVLTTNNDLASAALSVKKARLEANLAQDQYLPDVSSTFSYTDTRQLYGNHTSTKNHSATLSVGYELDLWGKLARDYESTKWEAIATQEDLQSTAIELVATTMQLYWKLGYLNEQIQKSNESIRYAKKTLKLVQVQHKAGATSAIEELAARQNLAKQKAAHKQYLQNKEETQNAFNILFNTPPEQDKANPIKLTTAKIPPAADNTPALILHRRPDIRAAEHRLRKVLADSDAVLSSYLPSFSLTGSIGGSSIRLVDVLQNPIGTLGAGITLPFLNWYDMRNNIQISKVTYEKAVIDFRQTLYRAFADVEDALAARKYNSERGNELKKALKNSQKAESLYKLRYKSGYSNIQEWLDAQESRRSAELSYLENRYDQLIDALTLYKALGGSDEM